MKERFKANSLAAILAIVACAGLLFAVGATKFTNLETSGTMVVGTTLSVTGATTNTGAATNNGAVTNNSTTAFNDDVTFSSSTKKIDVPSASAFVLHFTSAIPIGSHYAVITTSGGALTLAPANTLAILSTTTATLGEKFTIRSSTTDVITFTDDGGLASSGLALGAATRALGKDDNLVLIFNGTVWVEHGFTNVQ